MAVRPSRDILFVADEWETLDHERDSTLHLARIASSRHGARCFWTTSDRLFLDGAEFKALLLGELETQPDPRHSLKFAPGIRPLRSFHSIHWRKDPPVDLGTMRVWSLLANTGLQQCPPMYNPAATLLHWNEKFSPVRYQDWAIPSLVADREEPWKSFLQEHAGKRIVAKPSGDAASRGVQFLPENLSQALSKLHRMREEFGSWVILQEYCAEILKEGEYRAFFIGGKIRAALRKIPSKDQPIMNFDLEDPELRPKMTLSPLKPVQEKRAATIAEDLADDGVYIATIDFIGDRILEINATSAGLLLWVDSQNQGFHLAEDYWSGVFDVSQ